MFHVVSRHRLLPPLDDGTSSGDFIIYWTLEVKLEGWLRMLKDGSVWLCWYSYHLHCMRSGCAGERKALCSVLMSTRRVGATKQPSMHEMWLHSRYVSHANINIRFIAMSTHKKRNKDEDEQWTHNDINSILSRRREKYVCVAWAHFKNHRIYWSNFSLNEWQIYSVSQWTGRSHPLLVLSKRRCHPPACLVEVRKRECVRQYTLLRRKKYSLSVQKSKPSTLYTKNRQPLPAALDLELECVRLNTRFS